MGRVSAGAGALLLAPVCLTDCGPRENGGGGGDEGGGDEGGEEKNDAAAAALIAV